MANRQIVDIADMKLSNDGGELVTYALGSCIGLSIYDPVTKTGALLHYMLPDSRLDKAKAEKKPFMFCDSGIITMFTELKRLGIKSKNLVAKAAGGANIMDPKGTFNIGKRNYLALKKVLWRFNIFLKNCDVEGSVSRNMMLNLSTGDVFVKYSGEKELRKL